MRTPRRAALAAAPLSLALLLAGACSDDDSADDATTTTTTTEATTSSSETTASTASTEPPSTPTTAATPTSPPATGTTAPPATEAPPVTEDGTEGEYGMSAASRLIRAWGAGDRDRALQLATPEVVDQLFGAFDPGGNDWDLAGCDGAAGTIYCTFTSASKAMTVTVAQPNVPDEDGNLPLISRVDISA